MKNKPLLLFLLICLLVQPVVSGSLLARADSLYNQGSFLAATSMYKKAAINGENPILCYFNSANAYFQIDSLPQSVVYYKSSLAYAPDFFRGHLNLAITYYTLGELGECIASVTRALEIEPDNEKAMTILAVSYRKAGSIPNAIVAFERLVSLYVNNDEAYIALAEMYRELLDDNQAIEWLLKYPGSGKNEAYVNQLLSEIYESNKNLEKAIYFAKEAFGLEPSSRWIFYRICTLLETTGNDLVSLEEAKRGLELFPDFAELAVFAGNIAFKYENLIDAQRYYSIGVKHGDPFAVIGLENIRRLQVEKRSALYSK